MPRPRKPNHLKIISGSRRKDSEPEVELPPVNGVPEPPDWLPNAHAVKEWRRLAPILAVNGLLTEGGLSLFATLCALHGTLVNAYANGLTPTGSLIRQYRALAGDFGLTPASATRVRPNPPEKPNRFLNRGRKPETSK